MRAIRFHQQGPPDVLVLEDVPPLAGPGPGEVRLDVRAASVNHLDIWTRRELRGVSLPRIPGADAAGVVAELGAGVRGLAVGDRVLIDPGFTTAPSEEETLGAPSLSPHYGILGESCDGTYRDELVLDATRCLRVPEAWDFPTAAAFPLTALTAWRMCVVRGRLQPGETVLILGAAAGVGVMCIQIAKLSGCRVLAAASTEAKRALCLSLGADEVIPYAECDWVKETRRLTGGRGADVTIDYVGKSTWRWSLKATRAGGRVLTCGATTGHDPTTDLRHVFFRQLSVIGSTMGSTADLAAALRLAERGHIRPVVDRVLPVHQAADAHQLIEDRAVLGKVVLDLSEPSP
ncbi:MAG: zinc-binding dehydrogenase [Deltaproteobacteria bacterium]|nr:zinc-binding dehydrogenase [Deltaproteobacteria bacterium]